MQWAAFCKRTAGKWQPSFSFFPQDVMEIKRNKSLFFLKSRICDLHLLCMQYETRAWKITFNESSLKCSPEQRSWARRVTHKLSLSWSCVCVLAHTPFCCSLLPICAKSAQAAAVWKQQGTCHHHSNSYGSISSSFVPKCAFGWFNDILLCQPSVN